MSHQNMPGREGRGDNGQSHSTGAGRAQGTRLDRRVAPGPPSQGARPTSQVEKPQE